MKVKVTEYWPGCVDRSDQPKVAICDESEVLKVEWLKEPESLRFDRGSLDSDYIPQGYIMRISNPEYVVALVHPVALT